MATKLLQQQPPYVFPLTLGKQEHETRIDSAYFTGWFQAVWESCVCSFVHIIVEVYYSDPASHVELGLCLWEDRQ